MKFRIIFLLLYCTLSQVIAQPTNAKWEYVQRYKDLAVQEMKRTGVPASIKLAQGILESAYGTSTLARKANNHFGIKCAANWKGETFMVKDDDYDENGQLIESCFRVYENAAACFIAHSEFLRDPNKISRYGFLFKLDPIDYKAWAKGLSSAGYATNQGYADALIAIIEENKLFNFDNEQPKVDYVRLINDVKQVVAKAGQTPEEIAAAYEISTKKILAYNEGFQGPKQPLDEGQFVFLQRKRRSYRGEKKYHQVITTDNMFGISQQYGVKLSFLYKRNRMEPGTEPAAGQKIRLRGRVKKSDAPKLRTPETKERPFIMPIDEGTGKIPVIDNSQELNPEDLKNVLHSSNSEAPTLKPLVDSVAADSVRTIKLTNKENAGIEKKNKLDPNPGLTGTGLKNTEKPISSEVEPATKIVTIPKTPVNGDSSQTNAKYVVKTGDTLYSISRRYKISVPDLKSLNGINADNIKVGQELIIKK